MKLAGLLRRKKLLVVVVCLLPSVYLTYLTFPYSNWTTRNMTRYLQAQAIHTRKVPFLEVGQIAPVSAEKLSLVNAGYGSCSMLKQSTATTYKRDQYYFFHDTFVINREPVASWLRDLRVFCQDTVEVYGGKYAVLKNVVLNPARIVDLQARARGGEEVRQVLLQTLDKEDYQFAKDFLQINCSGDISAIRDSYKLLKTVSFKDISVDGNTTKFDVEDKFTVATVRTDYANLHNWARAVYNVLLILMIHNVQPKDAAVVFLDGHPFTNLDNTWTDLFGSVKRVGHFVKPVLYRHLALGIDEGEGMVSDFRRKESAYLEECRSFILQQHNLNPKSTLKCTVPTITLLIRRNAVFHPRNIEGKVGRKIYNEAQLIDSLMTTFPGACVQGVLMESLPMKSQLQIISQTDILIGMHGAGMTHTLFLPSHAAVLELFAKGFKSGRPWFECYQAIARWRGLRYDSWENFDQSAEMPHDFTIVPADVVVNKTQGLLKQICNV